MKEKISKISEILHEKPPRAWEQISIDRANIQMLEKAEREDI